MKSTTEKGGETDCDVTKWSEIKFRRRYGFLSSVLLLSTVLMTTAAINEDEFLYVNLTRLAAFADDFRRGWPTASRGEFKIHLRAADPSSREDDKTACGYTFTARTDDSAATAAVTRGHLPAPTTFLCDGRDEYSVHIGGDASSYERAITLGADVRTVELETTGRRAVPIASLCFGFVGGNGVHAFCTDVELLSACQRSWPDTVDFGTNSVRLAAQRSYSCRRIVFRDVGRLADGFDSLVHGSDATGRAAAICGHIEFVRAEDRVLEGCVGEHVRHGQTTIPDRGSDDDNTDSVQFVSVGTDALVAVNRAYKNYCTLSNAVTQTASDTGPQASNFARCTTLPTLLSPCVASLLVLIFLP